MNSAKTWKFIGAASQGRGHLKNGIPCQDKIFHRTYGDVAVIALADGAGSALQSHYGAERVVLNASNYIGKNFQDIVENDDAIGLKTDFLQNLLDSLAQLANELNCSIHELASTLLIAASDGERYFLAHIGDGVIGYIKSSEIKVASLPDNGEFANSTVFITSSEALTSMKFFRGKLNDISCFILMSDGTEASFYNKRTKTLMPVLVDVAHRCTVFPEEVTQRQLQDSMDTIVRQRTLDDCSLIMMVRKDKHFRSFNDFRDEIKCKLLQIPLTSNHKGKRLQYFCELLGVVSEASDGATLHEIAKKFYLKPKYLKKRLNYLCSLGLIEQKAEKYKSLIEI